MRGIDIIWLLLMTLTVFNSLLAENAEPSMLIVVFVALSITWKGHMVVDRFMELKNGNPKIRFWMNAYFLVIPAMIIVVHGFPTVLADLTRLN